MIDVLRGRKKYLPLSLTSGYELSYFRKGDTLKKNYIIEEMQGNNEYNIYFPNGVNLIRLSRKFLISISNFLIFFVIVGPIGGPKSIQTLIYNFKN